MLCLLRLHALHGNQVSRRPADRFHLLLVGNGQADGVPIVPRPIAVAGEQLQSASFLFGFPLRRKFKWQVRHHEARIVVGNAGAVRRPNRCGRMLCQPFLQHRLNPAAHRPIVLGVNLLTGYRLLGFLHQLVDVRVFLEAVAHAIEMQVQAACSELGQHTGRGDVVQRRRDASPSSSVSVTPGGKVSPSPSPSRRSPPNE